MTLKFVVAFPELLHPCVPEKSYAIAPSLCQVFALRQLCQSSMTNVRADAWHLRKLFTYGCKKSGFSKDRKPGKSPVRKVLCFFKFCNLSLPFHTAEGLLKPSSNFS